MPFKTGPKFKYPNHPIISELNSVGYSSNNLHHLLDCTRDYSYKLLQEPDRLKLGQVKALSLALSKPIGYIINKLYYIPEKSPMWLDESYNSGVHVRNLQNDVATTDVKKG